jgi:hypothetical protein
MDRSTSRALWARIAAGDLQHLDHADPVDLHAWVRQVAAQLLEADDEVDPGRRPGRVVAAVGLSGKVDGYADLRELVNDVRWDFPLMGEGGAVEETRAQLVRQMVELARTKGLLRGVYGEDDKQAIDLVRKLVLKQI